MYISKMLFIYFPFCVTHFMESEVAFGFQKLIMLSFRKGGVFFWRISPSLGAFGTCWTCPCSDFWFNFAGFSSTIELLRKFLDDSACFWMDESEKHVFSISKCNI